MWPVLDARMAGYVVWPAQAYSGGLVWTGQFS